MIIVSACLMGDMCRYDAKICKNDAVIAYLKDKDHVKVCPEVMGGLDTPRPAAEIIDSQVINKLKENVTAEFEIGAKRTLELALKHNVELAILKAKSPSCGSKQIYDGTFRAKLTKGNGMTADLLIKNGVNVISENDLKN